ncbi:MAG: MFS transporter [Candidatus Thorarchaeota archaeon]|nr:MFS transporter [Candidatus Thorarchaeota archaeon]
MDRLATQEVRSDKEVGDSSTRNYLLEEGDKAELNALAKKGDEQHGVREALKSIFSWRNYAIYLSTAWVFNAFSAIYGYFNLYLFNIGWDFIILGTVCAITAAISAISRLLGGYLGDIVNRKSLSVIAMFLAAVFNLIMGLTMEFALIFAALVIYSLMDLVKGGSSAYILDNIPRQHSGLAIALFTAGSSFGILTLVAFHVLMPIMGFIGGMQLIFLIAGCALMVCTIVRYVYLKGGEQEKRENEIPLWRDFISENKRAVNLIFGIMPGVLGIVMLDALSDALFKFGALIYTNEFLNVDFAGINIIVLVSLLVTVPLQLKIGRMSDKKGMRRTALTVYAIMPICAFLLMIAQQFPIWAPQELIDSANLILPGLGVVFTTPFIAIVGKYVNDALWYLVLLTLIQKQMPRTDTSKILGVFWFIVFVFTPLGPFLGGVVFTFFDPAILFALVFISNIMILGGISRFHFGEDKIDDANLDKE